MGMDIYKISLISIGASVCIVALGIFMGIRGGDVNENSEFLTSGISISDEQEPEEPKGEPPVDNNLIVETKTLSIADKELVLDLSFDQNRLFFPIQRNPKMSDSVFLTFNEDNLSGPEIVSLLKDLKIAQVKGTFFVKGNSLIDNPELWQMVVREGHLVANYTHGDISMEDMDGLKLLEEIKKWELAAGLVFGEEYVELMKQYFPYFRFPQDTIVTNETFLRMVAQSGYRAVGWQYKTEDFLLDEDYESENDRAIAIYENLSKVTKVGPIFSLNLTKADSMYIREMISSLRNNDIRVRHMIEGFQVII